MRIVTDAGMLLKQLGVLTKLVPSNSGNVSISCDGTNLKLFSLNELGNFQSIVPCDVVEGSAEFAVAIEPFKTVLRGHSKVELDYQNTMLSINERQYHAELTTTDAVEAISYRNMDQQKTEGTVWKVTAEQGKWLKNTVDEVNLKVVEALSPFMPVTVKVTDKGAFVACYDNNHMAFIRTNEVQGNLDFTMPVSTLSNVLSAFYGSNYSINVGSQTLQIKSKLLKVGLNLPSADSYLPVSDLLDLANKTLKAKQQQIVVNHDALLNFIDSCKAVATKERSELKIKGKGQRLQMTVKTISGNVNQTFKVKNTVDCAFSLDFLYMEEAIRKSVGDDVTIGLIADTSVIVGSKHGYTIISIFG